MQVICQEINIYKSCKNLTTIIIMEKRYNACGGSFLKFKINMQSKSENHKHVHIIFRMKNAIIKLGYISPCMPYSTTKSQQDIFQNNICHSSACHNFVTFDFSLMQINILG